MGLTTETVGFRVTTTTKEELEAAAKQSGQTVADYLRNVVEGALRGQRREAGLDEIKDEIGELRRDVRAAFKVMAVFSAKLHQATGADQVKTAVEGFHSWIDTNLGGK